MNVTVNGEAQAIEGEPTVLELIQRLGYGQGKVAVAINTTFVPRGEHASRRVKDGDDVEIVEARQGG